MGLRERYRDYIQRKRATEKRRITYGRKIKYNWDILKRVNSGLGISREKCLMDYNGYLRWKADNRLCHRDIAFNHIYKKGKFEKKFSEYDVHHKDGNRVNNKPENLEILLREEHEETHGKVYFYKEKKYIRIAITGRKRRETNKAILIGGKRGKWYPKSQLLEHNGYLYATEWIYKKNRG